MYKTGTFKLSYMEISACAGMTKGASRQGPGAPSERESARSRTESRSATV
jgi:hypothetical protein